MNRSYRLWAGTTVTVVAAAAGVGALMMATPADPAADDTAPDPAATATIVRTDLSEARDLDGELGFDAPRAVTGRAPGIVTRLPDVGTVLGRGDEIYRVDDLPVVLLIGKTPLFRDIGAPAQRPSEAEQVNGAGAGEPEEPARAGDAPAPATNGPDVLVLERNLADLGFLRTEPDERVTDYTIRAIKEWQLSLGEPATGRVDPNRVLVLPAKARVDQVTALLGDTAATTILDLTSARKIVTVPVDASDVVGLKVGARVTVTLPDAAEVGGTIDAISRDAVVAEGAGQTGSPAPPQLKVQIRLSQQSKVRQLDSAPVTVAVPRTVHEGVLAVPIASLLALDEGGYAIEVVRAGRKNTLVAVETGMFADGMVEVKGQDLEAGLKIVTAS